MRTCFTLFLTVDVILNSVAISTGTPPKERDFLTNFGMTSEPANHQALSIQFECLPNGEHISDVPQAWPSSPTSERNNFTEMYLPSAKSPLRGRSRSPHAGNNVPVRFRTYTATANRPVMAINLPVLPSPDGRGYGLEQLRFIRLISMRNQHQIFELRKYTFPDDKSIKIRIGRNTYEPVSNEAKIVLSTPDGDVFAILESPNILSGIYRNHDERKRRTKINMQTGKATALTAEEVNETPVGTQRTIMKNYRVVSLNPEVDNP